MNPYALFDAYPRLAAALPTAGLLPGQTPVELLAGHDHVWVKRDDLTNADYGGNKIRKLDLLLARARADGKRDLLTFGYSGSNFVAATAWHGRKLGLSTHAFLLPQAAAPYLADNLAISRHAGARLSIAGNEAGVIAKALARSAGLLLKRGRAPRWIPPGGSTPLGSIGFVNAAFELRRQIDAGIVPVPERLYVAFSSMGTVAGLSLGLGMAGLSPRTRIQAVQVVDSHFASHEKLQRLQQKTCDYLAKLDPAAATAEAAAVDIRTEFFGERYAVATSATRDAMRRFQDATGARSDSAYSGKAMACLYADLDTGAQLGPALFWHTFNAHGRPPEVPAFAGDLAPYLQ